MLINNRFCIFLGGLVSVPFPKCDFTAVYRHSWVASALQSCHSALSMSRHLSDVWRYLHTENTVEGAELRLLHDIYMTLLVDYCSRLIRIFIQFIIFFSCWCDCHNPNLTETITRIVFTCHSIQVSIRVLQLAYLVSKLGSEVIQVSETRKGCLHVQIHNRYSWKTWA